MIKRAVDLIDKLAGLCGWVGVFLIIVLTVIMGWEVVMRYALRSPTKFAFDSSQMIQVFLAMLAANYVLREERHITVELLIERLSARRSNRLTVITSLISAAYCGMMVYLSWLMALASLKMGERTMVMEAPVFPLKLAIAVGFALFGLQFLARAFKYATTGESPAVKHVVEHALPLEGVTA